MEGFNPDEIEILCHICGKPVKASKLDEHLKAHTAIETRGPDVIQTGKCVMAVFGRIIVKLKIIGTEPMNPWRVYAVDTHGRKVIADLRHAFIITEISEEDFARTRRRKRRETKPGSTADVH